VDEIAVLIAVIILCISAPFIARKWGTMGGIIWAGSTISFLLLVIFNFFTQITQISRMPQI
jgi:hypothetical protein